MMAGRTDHVPKRVNPDERREAIAEAVYQVIGDRGWDAVTLRDVASTAGVSMGQVQHYFATKTEMLLFALTHMRARVMARLERQLADLPQPVTQQERIRATVRAMLPVDEPGRQEAAVNIAFFSAATVTPEYAKGLRDGYARQLAFSRATLTAAAAEGLLSDGIDPVKEADAFYFLVQGLIGPVLIGQFPPEAALDLLDHQLSRIFKPSAP
jgi:TetR/AcrR family transcriptional repressor of bet genes